MINKSFEKVLLASVLIFLIPCYAIEITNRLT